MKHKNLKRRAFTMIELITAVVLVSILATVAIVGYQSVVTRAAESATETSLKHIDSAVDTAFFARSAQQSSAVRLPIDFDTAAYGTGGSEAAGGGSEIFSGTGSWDLRSLEDQVDADGSAWDPQAVVYHLTGSGITGMVKTVIEDDEPNGNDEWHLSFLKTSPQQTVTWSAWCDITPADMQNGLLQPTDRDWPKHECRYEGEFQVGPNPFPAEFAVSGLTPGLETVSLTVEQTGGYADSLRIDLIPYESMSSMGRLDAEDDSLFEVQPIVVPAREIIAGVPATYSFDSSDGVQAGVYYAAQVTPYAHRVPESSVFAADPERVLPWGTPLPEITSASFVPCTTTPCVVGVNYDPTIELSWVEPTDYSAPAGYYTMNSGTVEVLHRLVGSEDWTAEVVPSGSTYAVSIDTNTYAEGASIEVGLRITNDASEVGVDTTTPDNDPIIITLPVLPGVDVTGSHDPSPNPSIDWSWNSTNSSSVTAELNGVFEAVSGNSHVSSGLAFDTDYTFTVEACNDDDTLCARDSATESVGNVPNPPAPGKPKFVQEDEEANPDVWFETSNIDTSTNEYRLRRAGTTATFTGTKEFANVGQFTEVCVEQQSREKNGYGWSDWSTFGPATCHTTGGVPQSCPAPGSITVSSSEQQDLTPHVKFTWTDRNPNHKQQYSRNGGAWTDISIHATDSDWLSAPHGTTQKYQVRAQNICSNNYGTRNSSWTESNTRSEWVGSPIAPPTLSAPTVSGEHTQDATPQVRFTWSDVSPTKLQYSVYDGSSWSGWTDRTPSSTQYGWTTGTSANLGKTWKLGVRAQKCVAGNNYNRTSPSGSAPEVCNAGGWQQSNTASTVIGTPVDKPSAPPVPSVNSFSREQTVSSSWIRYCSSGAHEVDIDKRNTSGTWYDEGSNTASAGCKTGHVYGGSSTYANAAARRYVWGNNYNRSSPSGSAPKIWSDWSARSGAYETWLQPFATGYDNQRGNCYWNNSTLVCRGEDEWNRGHVSFDRNGWTGAIDVHWYRSQTCSDSAWRGSYQTNNDSSSSSEGMIDWIDIYQWSSYKWNGVKLRAAGTHGGGSAQCKSARGYAAYSGGWSTWIAERGR